MYTPCFADVHKGPGSWSTKTLNFFVHILMFKNGLPAQQNGQQSTHNSSIAMSAHGMLILLMPQQLYNAAVLREQLTCRMGLMDRWPFTCILTCIGGHVSTNLAAAFSPQVKGHDVAMLPHMVVQLF